MAGLTKTLVIAILISLALYVVLVPVVPRRGREVKLIEGVSAPPIVADGWLNGRAPTEDELRGKVVVIEAWATWCGPCIQIMPDIKRIHRAYADRDDVLFMGLTREPEQLLPRIKEVLGWAEITWLNGYGADQTLGELNDEFIPRAYVISRTGHLVWRGHPLDGLESAIDQALALPE